MLQENFLDIGVFLSLSSVLSDPYVVLKPFTVGAVYSMLDIYGIGESVVKIDPRSKILGPGVLSTKF